MTRGFITVATGDKRYYKLAVNLLHSYKDNYCEEKIPFAILTDERNRFTEEFDDVVILKNPQGSWMDKMSILDVCPYDENIFIDADCLIYQDISYLWNLFKTADDFSCFGEALPLDAENGWFKRKDVERYQIKFITHLHGIMYFVRKGESINRFKKVCDDIIRDYFSMKFKGFNDKLAEEPVFALAMAVQGHRPIQRKAEYYCFVPYATEIKTDYLSRRVEFVNPKDGRCKKCSIVHWGNQNTKKAEYKFEIYKMNTLRNNRSVYKWYCIEDMISEIGRGFIYKIIAVKQKAKKVFRD